MVTTVQQGSFSSGRKRIEVEEQRDFTGGLNLSEDPYNLGKNESFDLQNVDIDRRGGFGVRRGSKAFIATSTKRIVTATGASRTGNVVTATGLSPANGDPDGLKPGQQIRVVFADSSYDGTFIVSTAVAAATTATWAQTAADDASAGAGTITEGFIGTGSPDSGYTYVDPSLTRHILVARGGHVKRWDGSTWQDVLIKDTSGRTIFTEMENALYILPPNGSVPWKWTGSGTATALTAAHTSYNDNLTAPAGGVAPVCNAMAVLHNVMWAGGVNESTGFEDSRLRWSHPGTAEDWRTNDFIDIDKDDEKGRIRALVPFGDRLLVFKDKAVYAVHGYPPAGFSVQNLTKEIGTPSQQAVVATEEMVYFWDVDTGAWSYDGKQFKHIFQPLYPLIDDNKINNPFSFQVIAEFHNERLWLSVPFLAPPYASSFVSLVFDPNTAKDGAWMVHTKTSFGWWRHRGSDGGDVHLIGGDDIGSGGYLMEFDVENLFTDQDGVGTPYKIDAWYTTRWFDARNSAVKKRWKRPIVIMRGGATQTTVVDVLSDYNPTKVDKTFQLFTLQNGTEGQWDVSDWDDAVWAAEVTLGGERSVILRGAPLGTGTAKALRFKNTVLGQDWRVHGLTMKWISKRLRN